jgi:hypothetical protein
MPDKTNVFISYAHQDTIIARAIRDQLMLLAKSGEGSPALNCFLDTESIEPGRKYEPIIKEALAETDWLLVVFTGDQSVYCGFEIGMYSIMKPQGDKAAHEKPVACLHDVDRSKLPALVEGYSTTQISPVAAYLPELPPDYSADVKLWWNSPVGQLLRTICQGKGLYTTTHRKNDPGQFQIDIAQAASRIAKAFEEARQEDEVSENPVQAAMELTVFPPFGSADERIPAQSRLLGSSRAFEILGLNVPHSLDANEAPHITWGELRQALLRPERQNIPWMDRLETNIRLAAALKAPQPDDVTFRGAGRDARIYRAILTRYKLYKNGKRRFFILLVETFDRRFVGELQTSMLLTALTLASRWRFSFFERWHETLKQFDENRSDREFQDACRQLEYNMEWIENEGVELGADDPNMMVEAFGLQHKARVERFYTDFYTAKKKMKERLPSTFEGLKLEARTKAQTAIVEFLTAIKKQNAEFLELCVHTYAEKIGASPEQRN